MECKGKARYHWHSWMCQWVYQQMSSKSRACVYTLHLFSASGRLPRQQERNRESVPVRESKRDELSSLTMFPRNSIAW